MVIPDAESVQDFEPALGVYYLILPIGQVKLTIVAKPGTKLARLLLSISKSVQGTHRSTAMKVSRYSARAFYTNIPASFFLGDLCSRFPRKISHGRSLSHLGFYYKTIRVPAGRLVWSSRHKMP